MPKTNAERQRDFQRRRTERIAELEAQTRDRLHTLHIFPVGERVVSMIERDGRVLIATELAVYELRSIFEEAAAPEFHEVGEDARFANPPPCPQPPTLQPAPPAPRKKPGPKPKPAPAELQPPEPAARNRARVRVGDLEETLRYRPRGLTEDQIRDKLAKQGATWATPEAVSTQLKILERAGLLKQTAGKWRLAGKASR